MRIIEAERKDDYARTVAIRQEVFVLEQKVPEELEIENEEDCAHFLALVGRAPAGCVRVRRTASGLKIERLAVREKFRKMGVGRALLKAALKSALSGRPKKIYMNAQKYLEKFYESFGFERKGEDFSEAGMPHVRMVYRQKEAD